MKTKIIYYICYIIVLLVQITACSDVLDGGDVCDFSAIEGELTLHFEELAHKNVHISRSSQDQQKKERIESLQVYIFNESGRLTGYTELYDKDGSIDSPQGQVTVHTRGGKSYIYAIANLLTSQYDVTEEDFKLLQVDSDQIQSSNLTRDLFLKIRFKRQPQALMPLDNLFLMSGYVNNGNFVTISPIGNGKLSITEPAEPDNRIIKLYRILSSNTIKVKTTPGHDFKLTKIELRNVANTGTLLPASQNSPEVTTGTFEQMNAVEVTTPNTFEFYLPENIQQVNPGTIINKWENREDNTYDQSKEHKIFTKAPANASYIILYGKYINERMKRAAEVAYTIHFGDIGAQFQRLDNFNVERNCKYTYSVTINGVEDIIVEAKKEGNHPYAEGVVLELNNGKLYELDAHYESRILKFIKGGIFKHQGIQHNQRKFHGYMTYISTPLGQSRALCIEKSENDNKVYLYNTFDAGAKTPLCEIREDGLFYDLHNGTQITDETMVQDIAGTLDDKWVKFRRNTEENKVYPRFYKRDIVCKYPGDQFFMKSPETMNPSLTGDKEPLINIYALLYQLVTHEQDTDNSFWNETDNQGQACVYYTCFVDENYYENERWDKYVNTPNRIMHVASHIYISEDQHSAFTDVLYTLSQRSIKTFYNPNLSSTVKAYGMETVSEEQHPVSISYKFRFQNYDYDFKTYRDNWNGYTSTYNEMLNCKWSDEECKYVPQQQPLHTSVCKAMLTRNRDLNGDGILQKNEIRWYVGSEGQYAGAWYGEDIFPAETRLFDINLMNEFSPGEIPHLWHYFTSSPLEIFWAEEGSSTSTIKDNENPDNIGWSRANQVRCFRTLESNGPGLCDPEPFWTHTITSDKEIIVDLNRMDSRALRTNVKDELGIHYERDEQNRLPKRFIIAKDFATNLDPNAQTLDYFTWQEVKNNSNLSQINTGYTTPGWRLPNQRELGLMSLVDNERYREIWCRTKFNGSRYGKNNISYKNPNISGYGRLKNGNITVEVQQVNLKIICVKDL